MGTDDATGRRSPLCRLRSSRGQFHHYGRPSTIQQRLEQAQHHGERICGRCQVDAHGQLITQSSPQQHSHLPTAHQSAPPQPASPRAHSPWRRHVLTNGLALLFAFGVTGCDFTTAQTTTQSATPSTHQNTSASTSSNTSSSTGQRLTAHNTSNPSATANTSASINYTNHTNVDPTITDNNLAVDPELTITDIALECREVYGDVIPLETEDTFVGEIEMAPAQSTQRVTMGAMIITHPRESPKPDGPRSDG